MVRCFAILFLCVFAPCQAIVGDFDADDAVEIDDLQLFAASWLTDEGGDLDSDNDTDFADFCIFAQHWLEGCDALATVDAVNVSASVAKNSSVQFDLTATSTASLSYTITSLPAYGSLYDFPLMTHITSVPYGLYGKTVTYLAHPTNVTPVSFTWSATTAVNDCGQTSTDTATAAITIYIVPTATAQAVSATTYIWQPITLAATDDGFPTPPGRLKYIISTLPTVGLLYDPKSGAGQINKVPYTLSSWGTDVLYITDTAGNSTFGFKATDCGVSPFGGIGGEATVSITAAANPLDCLSFDGQGSVSIPDGTYLDAVDGWAIDFWVKTRQPYAMLIDKRATGAGYEIKLVAGRPCVEVYDATGLVQRMFGAYFTRIDDDQWYEIEICTYTGSGSWNLYLSISQGVDTNRVTTSGSLPDFTNADSIVIGSGYKGQIDKLRTFSGITNPDDIGFIVQFAGRTDVTYMFEMTPSVQFNCNEGTGTTITDSKTSKVGTFSSSQHVAWHPWIVPFVDVSVQSYGGGQ